jgi:hypothetical protein
MRHSSGHKLDLSGGLRSDPLGRSCASPGLPTNACDTPGTIGRGPGSETCYSPRKRYTWRQGSIDGAVLSYKQVHGGGTNTTAE